MAGLNRIGLGWEGLGWAKQGRPRLCRDGGLGQVRYLSEPCSDCVT